MTKWNPTEYARNSAGQLQWAKELESRLALRGTETLLDLGCGDGKITASLARALPHGRAVGIDSSEEMIQYAQTQHQDSANLLFRCLDVRALDYLAEFDVIFSNAALHWVDNHPAILAGAYRALRTPGRLLWSFGGKGNAAVVMGVALSVAAQPEWREHFQGFTDPYFFYGIEEYQAWLAEAGFLVQRLELIPKDMLHPSLDAFTSWIRTTWMPVTGRVPEARREDFIQAVVAAYLESCPLDSAGKVHVQMVRLEVEADKP